METPQTDEDTGPLLTSYRVTWTAKDKYEPRTAQCIVNSDDMTRPGDPAQRDELLRKMIALRHLPMGQTSPDNVQLLLVDPLCNCAPFPGENCAFAADGGARFHLTASPEPGFEWVSDRADLKALALVHNTLSVDVLSVVRQKYGHQ